MAYGTFTDVTAASGVATPVEHERRFFDYDRDGDLDFFVANYLDYTVAGQQVVHGRNRRGATYRGQRLPSAPDRLSQPRYGRLHQRDRCSRHQQGGRRRTGRRGGRLQRRRVARPVVRSINPNQLWINQHDGTFADEGPLSGAALNAEGNPEGSMVSRQATSTGTATRTCWSRISQAGRTFVLYRNDGHGHFDTARVVQRPRASMTPRFTGFGGSGSRLHQRRLASRIRCERSREHHSRKARAAIALRDDEPVAAQRGKWTAGRFHARRRSGIHSRWGVAGCGVWRR